MVCLHQIGLCLQVVHVIYICAFVIVCKEEVNKIIKTLENVAREEYERKKNRRRKTKE